MIKGNERYILPLCFTIVILLSACNSSVSFTDSVSIPSEEWTLDNVAGFDADITDTLSFHDISFTIRTGSSYPFRNIFLFVSTTSPEGKIISDTLEYVLADEMGKWYGKGLGDIHELKLTYKSGVYFPVKGVYAFRVRHGMRSETLKGVYDIGIRIEKSKE